MEVSFVFLDDFSRPSIENCAFHVDAEVDRNFNRAFTPCQDRKKQDKEFYVTTYVYDCSKLNRIDVNLIASAIRGFVEGYVSGYADPLDRDKAGKVYELRFDYKGRPTYSSGKINGINPTVKIIKEERKKWTFEDYIQYVVECAFLIESLNDNDSVKNLVVGPYQSNSLNEGYVIKSPDIINLYD